MTNVESLEAKYKGYIYCQIIPSYEVTTEVWIAEPGLQDHTCTHEEVIF